MLRVYWTSYLPLASAGTGEALPRAPAADARPCSRPTSSNWRSQGFSEVAAKPGPKRFLCRPLVLYSFSNGGCSVYEYIAISFDAGRWGAPLLSLATMSKHGLLLHFQKFVCISQCLYSTC